MAIASAAYDAAATLVRNRVHVRVIDYIRRNPGAHVADILTGASVPQGTLGRVLRVLVDIEVLTVDVPSEKRTSAHKFRYAVNERRIAELLAVIHTALSP